MVFWFHCLPVSDQVLIGHRIVLGGIVFAECLGSVAGPLWRALLGALRPVRWRYGWQALLLTGCSIMSQAQAQKPAAASAVPAVSILKDGGFDGATRQLADCTRVSGSLPMSWGDNSCWHPLARVSYEAVVAPARSGKALQVTLSEGVFQLVQHVTMPVDSHLRAGIWVRAQSPMMVKVSVRQGGAPYLEYGARTLRVGDEWTWLDVSAFSHGLWEQSSRQAVFMVSSATPGILWVDDASLIGKVQPLSLPKGEVPVTFFGTHIMHARNVKGGLVDSQAGAVRIWDSSESQWFQVQKSRPQGGKRTYQWGTLDDRVLQAERQGTDLLMVLGGYAPAWASLSEDADIEGLSDCYRCDETPRRLGDWQNWVSDLVGRYNGRAIRSWEIWNEPNFPPRHPWCPSTDACRSGLGSGYRGTPEQLLELQNEAIRLIRQIDATAQVVTAGISYHHRNYLDYFLRIGGGKKADAIGYHIYQEGPPELLMPHVLALRGLMQDHGLANKPLWSTESAISEIALDLDPAVVAARQKGLQSPTRTELGPAYLARFFVVGWASGLGRIYQYAWDDQHGWPSSPTYFNRRNNATTGVNATGEAFRQVRRWLTGQTLVRMETGQSGGLWRAVMKDSKGRESHVMWHPAKPADAGLSVAPLAGAKEVCRIDGSCQSISTTGLSVDFRPVWVRP